jgi:peptide deformylase
MMTVDTLKLVSYNDSILHNPCQRWDFVNPAFDLIDFAQKLTDKMRESRGIGLAANQVGVPYKIFSMYGDPTYVVVNPRIIDASKEMVTLEEGCLSYPGLLVKVKRPIWINTRFNYPNGQAVTHRFEGMSARVFLHEFDHIEYGHTFFDQANPIYKEKARKDWKSIQRKIKARNA